MITVVFIHRVLLTTERNVAAGLALLLHCAAIYSSRVFLGHFQDAGSPPHTHARARTFIHIVKNKLTDLRCVLYSNCRSQWPRGRRRRSAAARLLKPWVRIPPGARMFVCCECCVLSGRGRCDELITRPEQSYRLWCVVVCDLETSRMRRS